MKHPNLTRPLGLTENQRSEALTLVNSGRIAAKLKPLDETTGHELYTTIADDGTDHIIGALALQELRNPIGTVGYYIVGIGVQVGMIGRGVGSSLLRRAISDVKSQHDNPDFHQIGLPPIELAGSLVAFFADHEVQYTAANLADTAADPNI
jgi:hypothetical protein